MDTIGSLRARLRAAVLTFVIVLPAVACSGSGPKTKKDLPPRPEEFVITLADYRFEHNPVAPSGRVVLRMHNTGSTDHSLSLIPLPDDFPPLDEQLRGDVRRSVAIVASMPDRAAGTLNSIAVDLAPGRYGLVCNTRFPDGTIHGVHGMNSEFRVRQLSGATNP